MSARITRSTATSLRAVEDWTLELSAALAAGDVERTARAAATIAQAVREVQLVVDPRKDYCAALTLVNGVYSEAHRPVAALAAEREPSPYCAQHHPIGSSEPCRACGAARAQHDASVRDRRLARLDVGHSTADVQAHGHACGEQQEERVFPAVDRELPDRAGAHGGLEGAPDVAELERRDARALVVDGLAADSDHGFGPGREAAHKDSPSLGQEATATATPGDGDDAAATASSSGPSVGEDS